MLTPADLVRAVMEEDLGVLCEVPGIGRKTAARLMIDLRSRLELSVMGADGAAAVPGGLSSSRTEVREALAELGYGTDEIRRALDGLPPEGTVEDLLRGALRELAAAR
jgi:Holliday junction DNA helicase RuvA